MTLYSSSNLFFIRLFTLLVPRFSTLPSLSYGRGFSTLFPAAAAGDPCQPAVITGGRSVERLVVLHLLQVWPQLVRRMLMMRLPERRPFPLIGQGKGERALEQAPWPVATGRSSSRFIWATGNSGGLGLPTWVPLNVLTFREAGREGEQPP